jgi:hypothetical protein
MATQKRAARNEASQGLNRRSQSLLVSLRTPAWRRAMRPRLAKRQIATEHGEARGTEGVSQCNQQRSVAVRSRAMRKYEAVSVRIVCTMQKAPNGYAIR